MTKASKNNVNPEPTPAQGDGRQMYTVSRALDPRHPSMEVGRMLEEVKMAPDLLLRVIDGAILPTYRTKGVATSWEVHMEIQALFLRRQPDLVHRLWWN